MSNGYDSQFTDPVGAIREFAANPGAPWLPWNWADVVRASYPQLSAIRSPGVGVWTSTSRTLASACATTYPKGAANTATGVMCLPSVNGATAIQASADNGASWAAKATPTATYTEVVKTSGTRFAAASTTANCFAYTDSATSAWITAATPPGLPASDIPGAQMAYAASASTGVLLFSPQGTGATSYLSFDGGANYTAVSRGVSANIVGSCYAGSGVFICITDTANAAGLMSMDAGQTWVTFNMPPVARAGLTVGTEGIASNGAGVVVVTRAYSTNKRPAVWRSSNYGQDWNVVVLPYEAGQTSLAAGIKFQRDRFVGLPSNASALVPQSTDGASGWIFDSPRGRGAAGPSFVSDSIWNGAVWFFYAYNSTSAASATEDTTKMVLGGANLGNNNLVPQGPMFQQYIKYQ